MVELDPERYGRRFPHELSGDERQRVAFARAVATCPAAILADEPTGMLDATLRSEASALMGNLARQHGTAILHITHDLAVAAQSCDRVMVMADGAVVELGPTSQVLHPPTAPDDAAADVGRPARGQMHARDLTCNPVPRALPLATQDYGRLRRGAGAPCSRPVRCMTSMAIRPWPTT